jgi:competence protein ComEC
MQIIYGDRRILLTGDIEHAAEEVLVSSRGELLSDVIKVPHHGSRTSSTEAFINAVDPSLAVISVGRRSMFGHPHPEVVERWRNLGATVLKTGERGTISVSTDGNDLNVESFVPGSKRLE